MARDGPAGDRVNAWTVCTCGHMMLLHDVEDLAGTDPRCCADGCTGRCTPPTSQNPGPEFPADPIAGTGDSPVAAV